MIGYTWSTPSTACLWALNAYFADWASGEGSKYSTAILPSIDPDAHPTYQLDSSLLTSKQDRRSREMYVPFPSAIQATLLVKNFKALSLELCGLALSPLAANSGRE